MYVFDAIEPSYEGFIMGSRAAGALCKWTKGYTRVNIEGACTCVWARGQAPEAAFCRLFRRLSARKHRSQHLQVELVRIVTLVS